MAEAFDKKKEAALVLNIRYLEIALRNLVKWVLTKKVKDWSWKFNDEDKLKDIKKKARETFERTQEVMEKRKENELYSSDFFDYLDFKDYKRLISHFWERKNNPFKPYFTTEAYVKEYLSYLEIHRNDILGHARAILNEESYVRVCSYVNDFLKSIPTEFKPVNEVYIPPGEELQDSFTELREQLMEVDIDEFLHAVDGLDWLLIVIKLNFHVPEVYQDDNKKLFDLIQKITPCNHLVVNGVDCVGPNEIIMSIESTSGIEWKSIFQSYYKHFNFSFVELTGVFHLTYLASAVESLHSEWITIQIDDFFSGAVLDEVELVAFMCQARAENIDVNLEFEGQNREKVSFITIKADMFRRGEMLEQLSDILSDNDVGSSTAETTLFCKIGKDEKTP